MVLPVGDYTSTTCYMRSGSSDGKQLRNSVVVDGKCEILTIRGKVFFLFVSSPNLQPSGLSNVETV